LEALGVRPALRHHGVLPYVTDQGNYILDCHCGLIDDPPALDRKLKEVPGVIEHGLFIGYATRALIGRGSGVEELSR
jgi:ribose 5-phosphate isomerase A